MRSLPSPKLLPLLVIMAAVPLGAQTSNLNVGASVLRPLEVLGRADLRFGDVLPGVDKTVGANGSGNGQFRISGESGAMVSISFLFPTDLISPLAILPIDSWTGCLDRDVDPAGCAPIVPAALASGTPLPVSGVNYVNLGATVRPSISQPAGSYAATVTITVAYL